MAVKKKSFIRGFFDEYRNVTWPSRARIVSYLWVVLVFVAVMGLLLGCVDFLLSWFFNWVFGLR